MEQDKQLKEILLNGADKASAGFTSAVMKKVHGLSIAPASYRPLVHPKLKRVFLFTFVALITIIAALCSIITLLQLGIAGHIQNIVLPDVNYSRVLLVIFIFWALFTANAWLEKKLLPYKMRQPKAH